MDPLIVILSWLNQDVEITITTSPKTQIFD